MGQHRSGHLAIGLGTAVLVRYASTCLVVVCRAGGEGQGGAALCRGWGVWFGTLAKRLCLRRCWGRAALELNPVDSRELHALRELRYSSWFFVLLSGMGGKSLERSSKLASLDFPPLNLSKTCWPPPSNSPLNSSPPPCDEAHWGLRPPLPMVKFVGSICMNTNPKI